MQYKVPFLLKFTENNPLKIYIFTGEINKAHEQDRGTI
jgi:hypothetical protein